MLLEDPNEKLERFMYKLGIKNKKILQLNVQQQNYKMHVKINKVVKYLFYNNLVLVLI